MNRLAAYSLAILCGTIVASSAAAEPPSNDKQRAAEAFDRAIAQFRRAEFLEAARSFLHADDLSPNDVALSNAMSAARKAGDHLNAARAAERAITRGGSVAVTGRELLAEAAAHLSRVEVACEPLPCQVEADGELLASGQVYLLPGSHAFAARSAGRTFGDQRITMQAGTGYRIVLQPERQQSGVTESPSASPAPAPAHDSLPDESPAERPLPREVFWIGVAATTVSSGVLVWSGLDTLAARRELSDAPSQTELDSVKDKIRRTDLLIGGTTVLAVATAVSGIWLVDWGTRRTKAQGLVVPTPGGVAVALSGRF